MRVTFDCFPPPRVCGEQIVRQMLQQVAEAGDKPTIFTISTPDVTWDFQFGLPFKMDLPKI